MTSSPISNLKYSRGNSFSTLDTLDLQASLMTHTPPKDVIPLNKLDEQWIVSVETAAKAFNNLNTSLISKTLSAYHSVVGFIHVTVSDKNIIAIGMAGVDAYASSLKNIIFIVMAAQKLYGLMYNPAEEIKDDDPLAEVKTIMGYCDITSGSIFVTTAIIFTLNTSFPQIQAVTSVASPILTGIACGAWTASDYLKLFTATEKTSTETWINIAFTTTQVSLIVILTFAPPTGVPLAALALTQSGLALSRELYRVYSKQQLEEAKKQNIEEEEDNEVEVEVEGKERSEHNAPQEKASYPHNVENVIGQDQNNKS